MSIARTSWSRFSKTFGATVLHPQFFAYKFLERDMRRAAKYASGTLVDIGCGAKPYKDILMHAVDEYVGLDYPTSPESMDVTRSEPPELYADALAIPLKDSCADTVMLTQVLEHVPHPERAIGEVNRILKKGGILIASVPMMYPIHSAPYDFFRYTEFGIRELLTRNGFDVEYLHAHGGAFTLAALLANVFMMQKLFNLSANRLFMIPAFVLAPVVLLLSAMFNLAGFVVQPLDRERRFTSNYFTVARRRRS